MFVTEDPYGTNTTSLYVYFTTDDAGCRLLYRACRRLYGFHP